MKEIFRRIFSFCTFLVEMWSLEYQYTKELIKEKYNVEKISVAGTYFIMLFLITMLFLIPEMTIFFLLGILGSIISYFAILIFGRNILIYTIILTILLIVGYIKSLVVSIFFYVAFIAVSIFMFSLSLTKKE